MDRKGFVALEDLGRSLAAVPGMSELIEEERATLQAAKFVQKARKSANLTQTMLAKKLKVTQVRISQMEKGEGPLGSSITTLERVARACGGMLRLDFERAAEHASEDSVIAAQKTSAVREVRSSGRCKI
jgi:transcriptional regulator with XRE-family HTH domain